VTGGAYAAERPAFNYYTHFLEAAQRGGIEAVCETEHFAAMIRANPTNRARLHAVGAPWPLVAHSITSSAREQARRDSEPQCFRGL
jgi:hypothetical protein